MPKRESNLEGLKADNAFLQGVIDETISNNNPDLANCQDYVEGREFVQNVDNKFEVATTAVQMLKNIDDRIQEIIDTN